MKRTTLLMMVAVSLCAGCANPGTHGDELPLPNVAVASELPVFKKQQNEIEIADSFNNMDPTMVLGAIVELKTRTIRSFDSVLKDGAKTERKAVSELTFKNFLENSVVAQAERLSFLKGQINDAIRAEVVVTEVASATLSVSAIDREKMDTLTLAIPQDNRCDYAVVVGYRDFLISANLFKDQGIEGNASGYGAKISGKWFGKFENSTTDHRIVAIYSPLPFVVEKTWTADARLPDVSLPEATQRAMEAGYLDIGSAATTTKSYHLALNKE